MQNRAATILLQLGLLAVVVAALPYKIFELDRYFVPKELILNAVAIIFAVILVARRRAILTTATATIATMGMSGTRNSAGSIWPSVGA